MSDERTAALEEAARVADNLASSVRGIVAEMDGMYREKWIAVQEACEDIADGIRSLKPARTNPDGD